MYNFLIAQIVTFWSVVGSISLVLRYIENVIIRIDYMIFFRGVRHTTDQLILLLSGCLVLEHLKTQATAAAFSYSERYW